MIKKSTENDSDRERLQLPSFRKSLNLVAGFCLVWVPELGNEVDNVTQLVSQLVSQPVSRLGCEMILHSLTWPCQVMSFSSKRTTITKLLRTDTQYIYFLKRRMNCIITGEVIGVWKAINQCQITSFVSVKTEEVCWLGRLISTITCYKNDATFSLHCFEKQDVESCISEFWMVEVPWAILSLFGRGFFSYSMSSGQILPPLNFTSLTLTIEMKVCTLLNTLLKDIYWKKFAPFCLQGVPKSDQVLN